ncbi:MAG: HNH endonuclease [Thalassospira sp.]|uniref:HNH endonuclease n=1 Tax=Thalassospira sp. TaxID=1912094 RepID=UPI003A89FB5D
MAISQKDIKLLWGRAGSKCAICRRDLCADKESVSASYTLGEQAHIVGEKKTAARGESLLEIEERNCYHNLILLCPTHHTEIDENEEDWPVERLYQTKSRHELWVRETLSSEADLIHSAKQTAVTSLIDEAVILCRLDNWQDWTSWALGPDALWDKEAPNNAYKFYEKVESTLWGVEFEELQIAARVFANTLNAAAQTFSENSEERHNGLRPIKFYKANGFNDNYHDDLKRYNKWVDECNLLVVQATKAANWFADAVRAEVNPMFYAEKGRFMLTSGPNLEGICHSQVLQYTEEEKCDLRLEFSSGKFAS